MRYFLTILIGIFVYVGCANNTSSVITTEESIEMALENESLLESWDNKENRIALLEVIRNAGAEGLDPEDYHYSDLIKFEDAIFLTSTQTEEYHKLLTESVIKYTSHLRNGKINPLEIYDDWEITQNQS